MRYVLAIRNQDTGKFDLLDASTEEPLHTGYTNINEMTMRLRKQGYTLALGAIINDHPKFGKCREGKYHRPPCPVAHGMIERKNNPDGSVTFECAGCHLITTLHSSARTQAARNRDLETRASEFFKLHQ